MLSGSVKFVDEVLNHLCSKGIIGDVTEWCEMRHDCVYVVTCPDCSETFTLTEEEYDLLVVQSRDNALACGIRTVEESLFIQPQARSGS